MTLWALVREQSQLKEAEFIDAVSRRLRHSHLMVLIIGDGIQGGVESRAGYLQLHAGLHVGLALVDLSVWRDGEGRLLVVPRIPLRAVLIERGVVTVASSGAVTIQPPTDHKSGISSASARAVSISEQEYFDQLEQRRHGLSGKLRTFLGDIAALGVAPEFRRSLMLRWNASPDFDGSAAFVDTGALVWLSSGWGSAMRLGHPEAGDTCLRTVANIVGGDVRTPAKNWPNVVGPNGRQVDLGTSSRPRGGGRTRLPR
jgi:hypothetical protein